MTDKEQKQIFSRNLNKYLELNEKTQKEVADAISVSPQTFNTWCQGIALPRMGKVQRLADYFKIAKSDLIDDKPDNDSHEEYYIDPETRRIAQRIFEDSDMRTLFDIAKDMEPDRLQAHIDFMKSLKKSEEHDVD